MKPLRSENLGKSSRLEILRVLCGGLFGLALLPVIYIYMQPAEREIPVFHVVESSSGNLSSSASVFQFQGDKHFSYEKGEAAAFIRSELGMPQDTDGLGFMSPEEIMGATQLRLRWRATGNAPGLSLSILDQPPNVGRSRSFMAPLKGWNGKWQETILPLDGFTPDVNAGNTLESAQLDLRHIQSIHFMVPPKSQLRLEVASIDFITPTARDANLRLALQCAGLLFVVLAILAVICSHHRQLELSQAESRAQAKGRRNGGATEAVGHPWLAPIQRTTRFCGLAALGIGLLMVFFYPATRQARFIQPNQGRGDAPGSIASFVPYGPDVRARLAEEEGQSYLELGLQSDNYTGFIIGRALATDPDSVLRLRWRGSGHANYVQLELRAKQKASEIASVYSVALDAPVSGRWMQYEFPIEQFAWNPYSNQETEERKRIYETDSIVGVALTVPPGTDLELDIADLVLTGQSNKIFWMGACLVLGISLLSAAEIVSLVIRRIHTEATLAASEERYETIFDAVHEGIVLVDPERRGIHDINQAACKLLGGERERLLRMDPEAVPCLQPAIESELNWMEWEGVDLRNRPMCLDMTMQGAQIDGRWMKLVVMRDVRERRHAQQERQRLEDQLMQSHKMEAIGRLAGGVAHDFNNLLTGVICTCELAQTSVPGDSEAAEAFEQIQQFVERASHLTRQLLTFTKQRSMQREALGLNDMIDGMLILLHKMVGETVTIEFEGSARTDSIKADEGQIEQVLMNLLVNARDAMPEGGVVRLITDNVTLAANEVPNLPAGEYVQLRCVDNGEGIDSKVQRTIFEPFFTTKPFGKGTGLGLSIVYGIVRQHGGNIAVHSEIGKGTTFRILLPVCERAVPPEPQPKTPERAYGRDGETIMVLEDNDCVRELLVHLVKSFGYRVIVATCPADAEPLLAEHAERIGLLLSDVIMPGENGPSFYQRMKPRYPELKVLFMSGYTDLAEVRADGLDTSLPLIQKPFPASELNLRIREQLDNLGNLDNDSLASKLTGVD